MSKRNDADLLELSGYWVYQKEDKIYTGAILNVNGNSYEVLGVKNIKLYNEPEIDCNKGYYVHNRMVRKIKNSYRMES